IGQCSHRKQGVWTIAFASKLAPTKPVHNAKRFSVGAHVVINYGGVPPPQRIAPTKPVYNAKRFGVGRMSSSNMSVCRPRMPLR
ncbi:hypothetical protein, partial [Pseudomonas syringae]|uniref:hypothetical protein n=1 Tax=Pseudomonas syringae TaxID=317 RepID=UPI00195BEBE6